VADPAADRSVITLPRPLARPGTTPRRCARGPARRPCRRPGSSHPETAQ